VAERILIVEDEPEFAALLVLWMERSGYRPTLATTGNDALRKFYEEHPDLVILDVALPGLDGWQVIVRIREFSRVPILMVTARSSESDKIRGLKLGADDYITKPLSFPELLARVEAAHGVPHQIHGNPRVLIADLRQGPPGILQRGHVRSVPATHAVPQRPHRQPLVLSGAVQVTGERDHAQRAQVVGRHGLITVGLAAMQHQRHSARGAGGRQHAEGRLPPRSRFVGMEFSPAVRHAWFLPVPAIYQP
jgi:DNA-binding response OmpR family regulator